MEMEDDKLLDRGHDEDIMNTIHHGEAARVENIYTC
jgi:hypothetical protein